MYNVETTLQTIKNVARAVMRGFGVFQRRMLQKNISLKQIGNIHISDLNINGF